MNIFVSDPNPVLSAYALDDRRLVKMILESAQMLSFAMRGRGPSFELQALLYGLGKAHHNHPCTKWVLESQANFDWLWTHANAMENLFCLQRNKRHAARPLLDLIRLEAGPDTLIQPRYFVNCTPHKDEPVHSAYRKTLKEKWAVDKSKGRPPTWTEPGHKPAWG
jgi:hypothetical protein